MKIAVLLLIFIFRWTGGLNAIDVYSIKDSIYTDGMFLANMHGEPSSIVNGCVNAITGDFNDHEVDFVLGGSDPLVLERSYCSMDQRLGSLFHGWNQNHYGFLQLDLNAYNTGCTHIIQGSRQLTFKGSMPVDRKGYHDPWHIHTQLE